MQIKSYIKSDKVIHPYEINVPLIFEKVSVFAHTPTATSLSGHLALFSLSVSHTHTHTLTFDSYAHKTIEHLIMHSCT